MQDFDVSTLILEDSINSLSGYKSYRFAKAFKVNMDLKSLGLKEIIPGNGTIWRLGIKSQGAFSINLIFSDYKLPPNAELFIYSLDKQSVIGAYTNLNNQEYRSFATSPVRGDQIYVELFEPFDVEYTSQVIIGQISHDYKNIFKSLNPLAGYGQSGSCEININCPQGQPWQTEKKAICKYVIYGTYANSGALINNTNYDGTPYILTASHCFSQYQGWDAKNAAAQNSIFYFNYESPTCSNQDVTPLSISGATLRAYWDNSDFFLVQLTSQPPQYYDVYYAGWDKRESSPASVVGIHHPRGDIKKISLSNNAVLSTDKLSDIVDPAASLWRIIWSSGVTEPSSSGSPLFNQNKKIVGQLCCGWSDCYVHGTMVLIILIGIESFQNHGQEVELRPHN